MRFSEFVKIMCKPHKCSCCRQILSYKNFEDAVCPICAQALNMAKTESCPVCNLPASECRCQPKLLAKSGSLCLCKLFFYHSGKSNEAQSRFIYYMKRNNTRRTYSYAADELLQALRRELDSFGLNAAEQCLLVNVPRGRKAFIKYGLDQSEEACKMLSLKSGIPYVSVFRRRFGDKEQKRLNAGQRRDNVKNMIFPRPDAEVSVGGKYIILFDDVVTTGASMAACIDILQKMEIKGVFCCALASDLKNKGQR